MYYLLGERSWDFNPARLIGEIDDQDLWWDDGVSFEQPPRTPIQARLRPLDPRHPSMSPELAAMYIRSSVMLLRDDLLAAFRRAGVDNFDVYDAELHDPDGGTVYRNYKAVNVIGLLAAADMEKSSAIVHDDTPLIDVSFQRLVLDSTRTNEHLLFRLAENNGAILVHQSVKDRLQQEGFSELEFYELDTVAI